MSSAAAREKSENDNSKKQCLSYLEESFHSAFVPAKASDLFYGDLTKRPAGDLLDTYCDYNAQEDTVVPLILVGQPGGGKSSILANWILKRKTCRKSEKEFLFYHFAGCSRNSVSVEHTLRRLMEDLKKAFDLGLAIHPNDDRLSWDFPHFLRSAAKRGRLVLILDGVHRIVGNAGESGIRWLPQLYPKNVRVILSLTISSQQSEEGERPQNIPDSCAQREFKEAEKMLLEMKRRMWNIVEVGTFSEDQVSMVVNELNKIANNIKQTISLSMEGFGNKLTIPDISKERLLCNPEAMNPLYLATLVRSVVYASVLGYSPQMCWERWCPAVNTKTLMQSVIDVFESTTRCDTVDGNDSSSVADPLLGRALILLYVSRHGLYRYELRGILTRLRISDANKLNMKGRLDTLKHKLFVRIYKEKLRLIDIFRSFDKDKNGTLTSEELLLGLQQLDIDVDKELLDVFITDIDANSDGIIDYKETIAALEKQYRQVFHGVGTFDSRNVAGRAGLKTAIHIDEIDFHALFHKLFCLGVLPVGSNALSLPLENEELRRVIYSRYIVDFDKEAKWRLFLVGYFSEQEPSLRRCEELLWHLYKCKQFVPLKHALLDLRSFDIMYNDELFKGELGGYLAILTRSGASHKTQPAISHQAIDSHMVDSQPFDLVRELSHAIDCWHQGLRPSAQRLSAMIDQMAHFLQWFDDNYSTPELTPSMMRTEIIACFEKIGDADGHNGVNLKTLQVGETIDLYVERYLEQSTQTKSYLLDRWIWIQLPWVLVRACELAAMEEGLIFFTPSALADETEESSKKHLRNQSTAANLPNVTTVQTRQWLKGDRVKGGASRQKNQIRKVAQAKASVSKKSANFQKVERLKMQISKKGSQGITQARSESLKTKDFVDLILGGEKIERIKMLITQRESGIVPTSFDKLKTKDFVDVILVGEEDAHNDSLKAKDKLYLSIKKKESCMHPNGFTSTSTEVEERSRQLGNVRDLYDGLSLELQEKKQKFDNLQHFSAQEELGSKQSDVYLVECDETIKSFQPRLEKVCQALKYVSRIGELFEAVDSRLSSCDPAKNDKKRLKLLDQQIALSTQQILDMKKQRDAVLEENDRNTRKVIPKLKLFLTELRNRREQAETKAEVIRREQVEAPDDNNSSGDEDANHDLLFTALIPEGLASLRMNVRMHSRRQSMHKTEIGRRASWSHPVFTLPDGSDKVIIDSSGVGITQNNALGILLERTGSHKISEATAQISFIQEVVKSHSILRDALADEVYNLKQQLRESSKRLEAVQIGSSDVLNVKKQLRNDVTNDNITCLIADDEPLWDEKDSKRMITLNQLLQNMRTGIGHVNKMLLGLKLQMGSIIAQISSHICDMDEDVRKMRKSGFLLLHVINTLQINNVPSRGRRASINTQLAVKQLDLVSRRGPIARSDKSQKNSRLARVKHSMEQMSSGKDEIRVKTRREADKHFESEMRQISLKLENDSQMQGKDSGIDRDALIGRVNASESDMTKFLSGALKTNGTRREQCITKNKGIVLQKIMMDSTQRKSTRGSKTSAPSGS